MNPMSPFTYYRRHKGAALLLIGLVVALTLGLFSMAHMLNTGIDNGSYPLHHLTRMSRVSANGAMDSGIASVAGRIQTDPDVLHVIPENGLNVFAPQPGGLAGFSVFGVSETDLPVAMEAAGLRLVEGELIEPWAAEIMLSQEIARALDLQVGDPIGYEVDESAYPGFATEMTLVGILESDPGAGPEARLGFVSYEYLDSHELYWPRPSSLLVIPVEGKLASVNEHLEALVQENGGLTSLRLETYERATEHLEHLRPIQALMYGSVDALATVAVALVVSMINRIAISQRLPEFGLLQAVGYEKRNLIRRLVLEVTLTVGIGWAAGLVCAYGFLLLLKGTFFVSLGWVLNMAYPVPFLLTLPIPLVVTVWTYVSVRRLMDRLDTIAIVEQGKLSSEEHQPRRRARSAQPRPLSAITFYARHRGRALMLIMATGLMVLGVAFPAFILNMMNDAVAPMTLSYTSRAGLISPAGSQLAVDAAVLAEVKAHPAVAHVIPVKALSIGIIIPPGIEWQTPIYAVRAQDMELLLDLYGLTLGEGTLIETRSSQVVLTQALARNRGVGVSDLVGQPVDERDGIPTEMSVVGLLESPNLLLAERDGYNLPATPLWIGLASYEFVESHERYAAVPTHALVIPAAGRESEMETWLEESIDSSRVSVTTLGTAYRQWRATGEGYLAFLAITEVLLVVVAAVALAVLNYIFFTQRRDEFGTLYAVGHARLRLIARTLQESVSVVAVAWVVGAVLCVAGVFWIQASLLTPVGMSIDLNNVTPWLFSLPIPVTVVAASVGTVAWALSRLDPVSVIERR